MVILFGKYRLGKKRVGYRNDFCLTCDSEKIAEQYRTFDLGHLFFIPVLPLGYRTHWHCTACGLNPHDRTRTSAKNLKIIVTAAVGLLAVLSWVGPFIPHPQDAAMTWSLRVILPLCVAGLVAWVRNTPPVPGLKERLSNVQPLTGDSCLYCQGDLDRDGYCAACHVRRSTVGTARA